MLTLTTLNNLQQWAFARIDIRVQIFFSKRTLFLFLRNWKMCRGKSTSCMCAKTIWTSCLECSNGQGTIKVNSSIQIVYYGNAKIQYVEVKYINKLKSSLKLNIIAF